MLALNIILEKYIMEYMRLELDNDECSVECCFFVCRLSTGLVFTVVCRTSRILWHNYVIL